jgi:hypothetical protein
VHLPNTRGHLPRLQGVRRRFSTSGRTSDPSPDCNPQKTASQLRRFLGMLNFIRRFLPHAAATQAPLHDVLSGLRVKGSHPVTWTPELLKGFQRVQGELVTRHPTVAPQSIRATCTRHGCLHVRHGCRATAARRERLAATRLLL